MVTSSISEGALALPEGMIRAVTRHAERHADLVGTYLRSSGLFHPGRIGIPPAAVLELAALLQLRVWEQSGIHHQLDVSLPTYRDAADCFVARCKKGRAEFEGAHASPLNLRVLRTLIENFAWDGPEYFNAEFMLGDVDEDALIDLLAEFVWTHRHELARLIPKGTNR